MKTSIAASLCAAALACGEALAQGTGMPTFDIALFKQSLQQYEQLKQQYTTLKQQYESVTGSYGRGQIGFAESVQASSVVPGSWQEVVAMQASGAFASKTDYYERLIKTMPPELFVDPKAQSATNYKLSTDSVRAAMAGGDVLYGEVQTHLNNLARLNQQVDKTTNIKDGQDLQNRIATENGMLQSALAKVATLNMNLQANLVNQHNQSTAETMKYFQRTSR
jgi:type IV secretion system protein VirB5